MGVDLGERDNDAGDYEYDNDGGGSIDFDEDIVDDGNTEIIAQQQIAMYRELMNKQSLTIRRQADQIKRLKKALRIMAQNA